MMMRMIGRIPAMSAAKQMRPEGPAVKVNPAIRIATATGRSRLVATARSIEHQVSSTPRATIGSGRSPLLNGSQNARKTSAPVQRRVDFREWRRPAEAQPPG